MSWIGSKARRTKEAIVLGAHIHPHAIDNLGNKILIYLEHFPLEDLNFFSALQLRDIDKHVHNVGPHVLGLEGERVHSRLSMPLIVNLKLMKLLENSPQESFNF